MVWYINECIHLIKICDSNVKIFTNTNDTIDTNDGDDIV